ncbi:hypothetical protein PQE68_gp037 [Bacillus phage vB_BanS_Sophrita]|uniref:Uncharacterized protein n=1 Tax=Bacillus phage vB_BanS_Sophrita TaxID=2894790 RepID=A0AAE8YVC0_9CAUD|nr:hypothetical protein PQE68_gp037 [Bacillus phage vB_BanS_Sophrita]UGO50628.1 hypothetical protein SOPHRITA_37 [Bacillus phage vB_BanS_Sophrita]
MKRKSYFLKKGNKKMSRFYSSQLELQEDHKERLSQEGFSIGVMKFSHTEEATARKFTTIYIDEFNKQERDNGYYFYGEIDGGSVPNIGDYIIEVQDRDFSRFGSNRARIEKKSRIKMVGRVTLEMVQEMNKKKREKEKKLLDDSQQEDGRLLCYTSTSGKSLFEEGWTFNAELKPSNISRVSFTVDREDIRIISVDSSLISVDDINSVKFI